MPQWTFLTNHALVLSHLAKNPRITALEISASIGITERTVRRIVADLDTAGYVKKRKQGRRIQYSINLDLSLRHHTHQEFDIGPFLAALGWNEKASDSKEPSRR